MRWFFSLMSVHLLLASICIFSTAGCNQDSKEETDGTSPTQASGTEASGIPNDGWWCAGHGIPEDKCSMCNADYAAKCRANGDWCEEHNRAMSNCFVCNPELEAEFAEDYEIRYGSPPPEWDPDAEHSHE